MKVAPGCRFFNSSAAGKVQMISPIPANREKITGLFRVRIITGRMTVSTYQTAAKCLFIKITKSVPKVCRRAEAQLKSIVCAADFTLP